MSEWIVLFKRNLSLTRSASIDCTLIKACSVDKDVFIKTLQGIAGTHHKHKLNSALFIPVENLRTRKPWKISFGIEYWSNLQNITLSYWNIKWQIEKHEYSHNYKWYRVSQKTEFYRIEHLQICHEHHKYFFPTVIRISRCSIWQHSVFLGHPLGFGHSAEKESTKPLRGAPSPKQVLYFVQVWKKHRHPLNFPCKKTPSALFVECCLRRKLQLNENMRRLNSEYLPKYLHCVILTFKLEFQNIPIERDGSASPWPWI